MIKDKVRNKYIPTIGIECHVQLKSATKLFAAVGNDDLAEILPPASSPNVIAVGGTKLVMNSGKLQSESAWSGAGSGCSKYESKPRWQKDTACKRRSIVDVSAVADPATGAAVYDSYALGSEKGWFVVGGTSLAAPVVAGLIGSLGGITGAEQLYGMSNIKDILSGKNGNCGNYLCKAGRGYDGPTGLGVLHF